MKAGEKIPLYCRVCRKSLKMDYVVTGDDEAFVLENLRIRCHHHPRVIVLKKYTEKMLLQNVDKDRVFL